MAPPALPGFTATTRRSAPAPRIATLPLTDSAARSSRSRQPAAGHNRSTGRPPHRGTGSHVPHESPDHARATSTPDTAWPINRHPPDSSQSRKDSLVLMSPKLLRRFISGSLALAFVIRTCRAQRRDFFPRRSPPRLLTAAARGGLRPPPARRPRRATRPIPVRLLHLSYSTASSGLVFYIQPPSTFVFAPSRQSHGSRDGTRASSMECPRICVGMSESECHAF